MSRQQKRLEREAKIIAAAIELLEEKSFLDVRMSEVAQAAECSMGAVYSHFSSKEDLLMACSYSVSREEKLLLRKVMAYPVKPLEQLILASLLLWRINNDRPQNYQLKQLAMNPSVWKRASSHRNHVMNDLCEEIEGLMSNITSTILKDRPEEARDEQADQLMMGVFGLTIGLYQIKESGLGGISKTMAEEDGIKLYFSNLERYLVGWGLQFDGMQQRFRELYEMTISITQDIWSEQG